MFWIFTISVVLLLPAEKLEMVEIVSFVTDFDQKKKNHKGTYQEGTVASV